MVSKMLLDDDDGKQFTRGQDWRLQALSEQLSLLFARLMIRIQMSALLDDEYAT